MPNMDLLRSRLLATSREAWFLAVASAALGIFLLCGAVWSVLQGQGLSVIAFTSLGGLGLLGVAAVMVATARSHSPPEASPVWRVYKDEPERIGWVYQKVGKSPGFVVEILGDGPYTLSANRSQVHDLIALSRARNPRTILGYGTEQRKAWEARKKEARAARQG